MAQHKAASIPDKGKPFEIVDVPTASPSEGQVLVKNHALAINPVDYYIRDNGYFVETWPFIAGSDTAGEVVEVGSGVSTLKKGDRVLVSTTYLMNKNPAEAGFQEYTLVPAVAATKLPDSMSFVDGTVIPLSIATAAAGLYPKDRLALDLPSTSPKPNGKKVLVWGASSSVGSSAIQLLVASGYEVITTASPKNFEYAKQLGASKVFDYNSPSVVGDITAELQEGKYAGSYDAIGQRESEMAIGTIVAQLGGGKILTVLPPPAEELPATVESTMVFAVEIFAPGNPVGQAVFQDFLVPALESGQFKSLPKADVVGNGLGALQDAVNKMSAGVSAKKLVVTL